MNGAFVTGLISGLIFSVMISPVFFTLINVTTSKGYEAGAMFISGIFTSNLILFITAIQLFNLLDNNNDLKQIIIYTSGILLIILCLLILFNADRKLIPKKIIYLKATQPVTVFSKGILLNILNPFVLILWFAIFSYFFLNLNGTKNQFIAFYFTTILIVLLFDFVKIILANKFTHSINPLYLVFLKKMIAFILIIYVAAFLF